MAYYLKSIVVPGSLEQTFEYLARFDHVAEWDPGCTSAEKISKGLVEVGSEFRVVAAFLGRRVELIYRVSVHEPPKRLVLEAQGSGFHCVDRIETEPAEDGTRIRYRAELKLAGWRRALDPALQLAFAWVAWDAVRGLQERLGRIPD